jgi:flagellin
VLINNELQYLNTLESGGSNSLSNEKNLDNASKILQRAIDEIAVMRGRLGAIERNTLQTNIRSLQVAIENTTAAESKIRDADFAFETSQLTRAQILQSAGTSVLATANQVNTSVLQLLG